MGTVERLSLLKKKLDERKNDLEEANEEIKKQQEIELLKKTIGAMIDNEGEYCLEIIRLHSIIKEVREAVETGISEDNYDGCVYDIKNILDKENL